MKKILFSLSILFSTIGFSDPAPILDCVEAFSGQLPQVKIIKDDNNLIALLSFKSTNGSIHEDKYLVKDASGLVDIRFVDIETSGSNFSLKGGKTGNPLTLAVQATTSNFEVVQATLHCDKN